jgi:hypothetical protein
LLKNFSTEERRLTGMEREKNFGGLEPWHWVAKLKNQHDAIELSLISM